MGKFKTNMIVAASWKSLGERRNALRVLFYEDLIAVDPTIQLIFSAEDADKHGGKLLDMTDALASGVLDEEDLVLLGHRIFHSGFDYGRIAEFTEVMFHSIKSIYVWDWTPEINDAWSDVLWRASAIVQNSNRRRHMASIRRTN